MQSQEIIAKYAFIQTIFIHGLETLTSVLEKAKSHTQERGIEESEILNARLAPDMFPFVRQIQIATDNAKANISRFAEVEIPKVEDNETTIDSLLVRVKMTLDYVQSFTSDRFANADNLKVTSPFMPGKYTPGKNYSETWAVQNFLFHVTTAYGILRNQGAQIGKEDFIRGREVLDLE